MACNTFDDTVPLYALNNKNNNDHVHGTETEDIYVLARTREEKSCFATFLNCSNVMERTIKHTNVLYICPEEQWKRRINSYLGNNGIFSYIGELTSTTSSNRTNAQEVLHQMSDLVVRTFHQLLHRRVITNEQYNDMMYYNQSRQFEVNKLDFQPKLCHNQIVLEPIVKCSSVEPMKGLLNLINLALQPLIEKKYHSKTFPTANEAIEALIRCREFDHLPDTPLFVTIDIHDLLSTLSHDMLIDALKHFLRYYKYDHEINGLLTTTIIQLVELFLKNQYCLYDQHKLYQQMRGSSIDSPLITTLTEIYLFHWQYDLLCELNRQAAEEAGRRTRRGRVFGRCHNHIFFIWHKSKDELCDFLNRNGSIISSNGRPDIQITVKINSKIQFLDAEISHIQGLSQTRVYHHPIFEPYALPYTSKIQTTSSTSSSSSPCSSELLLLLYDALIRAVLYCSNVREYENEQLYIELSFLLNALSLYLIHKTIENFFIEFYERKRNMMFFDEVTYLCLRSIIRKNYQQQSKYHIEQRQSQRQRYQSWL